MTANAGSVTSGSAVLAAVYLEASTDTATVTYVAGTYHGSTQLITTSVGANWGGWFYAQDLAATSSFEFYVNSTGSTAIGFAAVVLAPSTPGDEVLYDTSGGPSTTTKTQFIASVDTTYAPEWVGMVYSDNDGGTNIGVGTGESVLSDCNVPSQTIYMGVVDKTNPVDFQGGVTLFGNVTNYGGAIASGFLEMEPGPLSIVSFAASPTAVSQGLPTTLSVKATGGTFPYHYAYSALPNGCTSSNAASLVCIPQVAGTYTVTVQVNDSASGSVTQVATLNVLPGGPTCGGTSAASTTSTTLRATTAWSAVYATVWVGAGTATMWYDGSTFHGSMTMITSQTQSSWQGWFYATNLPSTSSLVISANATGTTEIGISAYVLVPSVAGDRVLYDASGSLGSETQVQTVASVITTHPPEWVGMGYSDDDGSPNAAVGTGETVLNDCNVPGEAIYTGIIEKSQPVAYAGNVSLSANVTNYANSDASAFYQGPPPAPSVGTFTVTPNRVDVNHSAVFQATVAGGTPPYANYAYVGLPAGCASANLTSLTCTPTVTGSFNVTFTVLDSLGQSGSASAALVVEPSLSVAISGPTAPTDAGLVSLYKAHAQGGTPPVYSDNFSWTWGDGTHGVGANQSHAFAQQGTYVVTLVVTDAGGGRAVSNLTVIVNPALSQPHLAATPDPADLDQPVSFTSQVAGGTLPYVYAWQFGDGGTGGDLQNITHIYTTNGPFSATVTVTDAAGAVVETSLNITIALTATITANATVGAAPLAVGFSSQVDGGVPGYSYSWTFGDGGTSDLAAPAHTYLSAGDFKAQLMVSDAAGHSVERSWNVTVVPGGVPLSVSLAASPSSLVLGNSSTITATLAGGRGSYTLAWENVPSWCDQTGLLTLSCKPTAAGVYKFQVSVEDSTGTSAQGSTTLTVVATTVTNHGSSSSSFLDLSGEWGYLLIVAVIGAVVVVAVVAGRKGRPPVAAERSTGPLPGYAVTPPPAAEPTPAPPMPSPGPVKPPWDDSQDPLGDLF